MARFRIVLAAAAAALSLVFMSLLGDADTDILANADSPSITITPDYGPPEGGGDCAISGVDGFVQLPTDVGIKFSGGNKGQVINPEVDDQGAIKVVIDFQYSPQPSSEQFLMGYRFGSNTSSNNAFVFSADASNFRSYYSSGSPSAALTVGASDDRRHTVTKIGTTNTINGTNAQPFSTSVTPPGGSVSGTSTDNRAFQYWGPLYLGGVSNGDYPQSSFVGIVYSYTIYQNDMTTPVRKLVPAAWANGVDPQGNQLIAYGFYDQVSKKLFGDMKGSTVFTAWNSATSSSYSAVLSAKLGGNTLGLSVNATTTTGQTFSFTPKLTCGPIPAHDPGYVPLVVNMNGTTTTVDNAYLYGTPAELNVVKRGWDCGDNGDYSYEQIMEGACTEIPTGSQTLPSGTLVTWTYTVTYAGLGDTGLTEVTVKDDKILGEDGNPIQICHFDTLPINTSMGCVATGEVRAGP